MTERQPKELGNVQKFLYFLTLKGRQEALRTQQEAQKKEEELNQKRAKLDLFTVLEPMTDQMRNAPLGEPLVLRSKENPRAKTSKSSTLVTSVRTVDGYIVMRNDMIEGSIPIPAYTMFPQNDFFSSPLVIYPNYLPMMCHQIYSVAFTRDFRILSTSQGEKITYPADPDCLEWTDEKLATPQEVRDSAKIVGVLNSLCSGLKR